MSQPELTSRMESAEDGPATAAKPRQAAAPGEGHNARAEAAAAAPPVETTQKVEDSQKATEPFQDVAERVARRAALDTETGLPRETVDVLGLPLAVVTMDEALVAIANKISSKTPGYFITANLHYARLTDENKDLSSLNEQADFIVADGMPLVWYSRFAGRPLPERVTGSDMIYRLAAQAAELGHRMFFLGGAPGVALDAANQLHRRHPQLQIAGVETPPFRPLTEDENRELVERIRGAGTDILLVALGQPKGERWIADNVQELGVPVCAQVGASFDFVAGRVKRAPKFYQKTGLEWAYRTFKEPKRMFPRYAGDAWFLLRATCRDVWGRLFGRRTPNARKRKPSADARVSQSPPTR